MHSFYFNQNISTLNGKAKKEGTDIPQLSLSCVWSYTYALNFRWKKQKRKPQVIENDDIGEGNTCVHYANKEEYLLFS